ncbi:MAG: peptide-binding protein, partial [Patescibacteria group bacterium]
DSVPSDFQIFLGDFQLSKDPDQYSLWHSSQPQNISNYQNLRIDKLLEDGRKTTDIEKRRKIYEDFQKYLLADSPASFLFFPYEYDLIRK